MEYANIYLTYVYRASPCESPWLDDDNLERQEPMLAVRAAYRTHGLAVAARGVRPDDHLSFQLIFVAHLLDHHEDAADLTVIADFLDQHPLRWIKDFAQRISQRSPVPFYVGLAVLTAAYLEELRWVLAELTVAPDGAVPTLIIARPTAPQPC